MSNACHAQYVCVIDDGPVTGKSFQPMASHPFKEQAGPSVPQYAKGMPTEFGKLGIRRDLRPLKRAEQGGSWRR